MTQTPEIPAFAFSDANLCPMTSDTVERDGFTLRATIYADDNAEPPWAREDGHGEVSDWTSRAKGPGELVLAESQPGGRRRFYDFAGACKIALADGWGLKDGRLEGESAKAYAARAARADFHRLKGWSDNQWQYVGVAVTVARDGVILTGKYDHALWGIESDSPGYLAEVANDLAPQALEAARAKLASMTPPDAASLLLDRCEAFLAGFEDDATQPSAGALLADLRAQRQGAAGSVLDRFTRAFPGYEFGDADDREAMAGMPLDSTCGDACRGAIEAAQALAAHVRAAYGDHRPDMLESAAATAVDVCNVYIRG